MIDLPPDSAYHVRAARFPSEITLLAGLSVSAAADIGSTIHGLNQGYAEGNPLMRPLAKAGGLPLAFVDVGLGVVTGLASHELKKQGSKVWWIPSILGIVGHSFAAYMNLRIVR